MNRNGAEFVEIFLQEASDRLQYLREYANLLLDAYPSAAELERLYIAAHTLSGTSASYGFPLFSEIAGKLAHIFQYAMHASIAPEAAAPLLEFISEAVALLESDLIIISSTATEAADDVAIFKQRYPFAFPQPPAPEPEQERQVVAVSPAPVPAQPLEEVPVAIRQDVEPEPFPPHSLPPESIPNDDEVPAEILEFFVPEAEEHLQIATQCLLALEESPSEEQVHRLLRAMHTVKGSAAQVGLHRISHVAHRAEDLIGRVRDGELQPTAQIIDICLESVDVLKKFLYRHWNSDADMQVAVQSLFGRIAAVSAVGVDEQTAPPDAPVESAPESLPAAQAGTLRVLDPEEEALLAEYAQARTAFTDVPPAAVAALAEPADKTDEEPPRKEFQALPQTRSVRVALERLDRMMNAVGELVINRTRMIGRLNELEHLADVLNLSKSRMQDKVAEFQEKHEFSRIHMAGLKSQEHFIPGNGGAYPSFPSSFGHSPSEFSELELDRYDDFNILSRSLTEISADISEVLSQLGGFVRRVDSDIDEFTKLAHRLQDEITQARMVPIGNLYTRLSRTVRDAAKAVGKRAELKLEGAETELDNNIIQQISDPLIHLVRNAVAHGIEREDERYEQGKSDVGNVIVRAYHRGNHIFVEVEDDGRGIDYEQVRKIAVDVGLVYPEAALELTQEELLDLLFQPGFSTAPRTTELAGRGVGLDVVRSNLVALNGEIEVHTEPGRGTRFTLKVPLTLVIAQALFVRCGSTMFAVPLTFIQAIRRVKVDQIEEMDGKMMTTVRDIPTEVLRVDVALGLEPIEPVDGYYRMVVVSATGRQVGLIVEDVIRKDEIVIKNLGDYLRKVKMFPGATIAPDGSLILLLDVNRLVSIEAIERPASATAERIAIAPPPASAARIFRPGAEAVAQGTIPQEAIDVIRDEKIVLLVDDSISVLKFVGRMLEKAGYRVKLAADGLEALEVIAQTRCDLVVTDLEMPRTNGYELLSHLRNDPETRSVPVMVVTSRAGAKHRDRAMKEGASAFLTKPVQEDHFVAAVGRLIGVSPALPAAKAEALQ